MRSHTKKRCEYTGGSIHGKFHEAAFARGRLQISPSPSHRLIAMECHHCRQPQSSTSCRRTDGYTKSSRSWAAEPARKHLAPEQRGADVWEAWLEREKTWLISCIRNAAGTSCRSRETLACAARKPSLLNIRPTPRWIPKIPWTHRGGGARRVYGDLGGRIVKTIKMVDC